MPAVASIEQPLRGAEEGKPPTEPPLPASPSQPATAELAKLKPIKIEWRDTIGEMDANGVWTEKTNPDAEGKQRTVEGSTLLSIAQNLADEQRKLRKDEGDKGEAGNPADLVGGYIAERTNGKLIS